MHVTVLPSIPDDPEFAAAWNQLALRMEEPEVFFTYEWSVAAATAFRDSLVPHLLVIRDGDHLCGIASLAATRVASKDLYFLCASTADYCDIVSDPSRRGEVLAAVFSEVKRIGKRHLELANIPQESITLRHVRDIARAQGFRLHHRPAYECGLLLFTDQNQRQEVLEFVQRKERERRALKKLERLGRVAFTHLDQPGPDTLQAIASAQIYRFLLTRRISPLAHEDRRTFLAELSQRLGLAGWLNISELQINSRPIAWNLGFRYGSSWFWYLPTFLVQYQDYSPGSCLLRLLIEQACQDESVKKLDLGLGDEPYKERFANAVHPTEHVQLTTSGFRHAENIGRYRISQRIKRSPRVESFIRKAIDGFRALRSRFRSKGLITTAVHFLHRAAKCIYCRDEIVLFEAPVVSVEEGLKSQLVPIDWQQIADSVLENSHDPETLQYLMRCAVRLKNGANAGFALRRPGAPVLHLLWTAPYNAFHLSEVDYKLETKDPEAAMLFDCWTPVSQRGHGNYSEGIRLAAAELHRQNKNVWIFSAAGNRASLKGIAKAGFQRRFSIVRTLWFNYLQKIKLPPRP